MKLANAIDFPRSGWCLCIILAGTTSLQAQSAGASQQETVTREFAQVLLTHRTGALRIGRMPENLPTADQLTAGARVIGSVIYPDRSESAIAVRQPVTEARQPFEMRLRAAGWIERPPQDGLMERGFLPAVTADPTRGFCWPQTDAQLGLNVRGAPDGGSYIVLNYYVPGQGRRCAAPPASQSVYTGMRSMMPALRPPDGAEVTGGGGGSGSGDDYQVRSTVTASHTPAQIIRHFQPQLREQGWNVAEQLSGKELAIVFARKRRDSGADLLLWVSATREAAEQVALTMRIVARAGSR
jgi:hypothetical protein